MQEINKRAKRRQTVSLSSTRRAALFTLKEMMAAGCDFQVRKKQFLASRTYCWNFLLREGYGSRAVSCKRKCSPQLREVVIWRPVVFATATASASASGGRLPSIMDDSARDFGKCLH